MLRTLLPRRRRLGRFESLEDRRMLTVIIEYLALVNTFADVVDPDDGVYSLREAVTEANGSDVNFAISLPAGNYPLSQGQITIDKPVGRLRLLGHGGMATIDAQGASRVLDVGILSGVELDGVGIVGGYAEHFGGGIRSLGDLTIRNSRIAKNQSGGFGGGIWAGHRLTLIDSTVSDNEGYEGGGLDLQGTTTIVNSTISGNTGEVGAGIAAQTQLGPFTIVNSTITANHGQGLVVVDDLFPLFTSLQNTIVAGNDAGSAPDVDGFVISDSANNVIGSVGVENSGLNGVDGNQVGSIDSPLDPLLGPLQDNGGPTWTHALLPGSPAINAGNNALAVDADSNPLIFDQRGTGFSRVEGGHVDVGAFELQDTTAPIVACPLDLTLLKNTSLEVTFMVGDDLTSVDDLVIDVASSNTLLIPDDNLTVAGSGAERALTIEPAEGQRGIGTVVLTVTDLAGNSAECSLTVTVNDAPVAADDAYETNEDTPLVISAPGVLANDDDEVGDPLKSVLDSDATHGSVMLHDDGSFTYTPDPDFYGPDQFTYMVDDGVGGSATATVTLTVISAEEQLESLAEQVAALDLPPGTTNALTSKLDAAFDSLEQANTTAGVNQIQAFVNQVAALLQSGRITQVQADELIAAANAAIDSAQSTEPAPTASAAPLQEAAAIEQSSDPSNNDVALAEFDDDLALDALLLDLI